MFESNIPKKIILLFLPIVCVDQHGYKSGKLPKKIAIYISMWFIDDSVVLYITEQFI